MPGAPLRALQCSKTVQVLSLTVNCAKDAEAPKLLLHLQCLPHEPLQANTRAVSRRLHVRGDLLWGLLQALSFVRPLERKSDVPALVMTVLTCMDTQSGHRCRVVRTDNSSDREHA
jgi:hypothetical protein